MLTNNHDNQCECAECEDFAERNAYDIAEQQYKEKRD